MAAPSIASAISMGGMTSIKPELRETVANTFNSFEYVTGRQFSNQEFNQIHRIIDQTEMINAEATSVKWGFFNTDYSWTIIICGQFKSDLQAAIPTDLKNKVMGKIPNGMPKDWLNAFLSKGTVEFQPCFDPSTGDSYFMGGGGGQGTTLPAILSGGLTVGAYFAPKNQKIVADQYVYLRFAGNTSPFLKLAATVGIDGDCAGNLKPLAHLDFNLNWTKCQRYFISAGIGVDIIGKIRQVRAARSQAANPSAPAPAPSTAETGWASVKPEIGVIINFWEHPWYNRVMGGMGLREAFADVDKVVK